MPGRRADIALGLFTLFVALAAAALGGAHPAVADPLAAVALVLVALVYPAWLMRPRRGRCS